MSIFYIDLVNGNDANSGVDWANAWKTLSSGPTAARLTPGDTMRVAKTPDAYSVGSSTWTDQQIGASIVFGSAPTKQIDLFKTGCVTLGAGATVTNSQTTAWVTSDPSDSVGKAVQVVTSASSNLFYKALGSTQNFSGYQKISFWFRPIASFDCTGAQNLNVRLCSDTAGATPVNTIAIPKLVYAANTWYPIVVDAGSALGSSIQSISFNTTNTTSTTFYFDEAFASTAGGIDLQSCISNSSTSPDFYPIRTIRNTDVHLMARYTPGTAQGACGTNCLGAAWRGTTGTYTAYARNAIMSTGTANSWPGNIENGTSSGLTVSPYLVSGGWDTSTTVQNGETWVEGLDQTRMGFSLANSSFHNHWRIEKFGFVRAQSCTTASAGNIIDQCSWMASGGFSYGVASWNTVGWTNCPTSFTIKAYHGNSSGFTVNAPSSANQGVSYTVGNCWGNGGITASACSFATVTIGEISSADSSTSTSIGNSAYRAVMDIAKIQTIKSAAAPLGIAYNYAISTWNPRDSICNIGYVESVGTGFFAGWGGSCVDSVFNIGTNVGSPPLITAIGDGVIFNNLTVGAVGGLFSSTINSGLANVKMYFHNYGGVLGASRVYCSTATGNNASIALFELQGTDVYTGGSKAWKYSISGIPALNGTNLSIIGCVNDLKLAAVAAEANKLVTITARVKRSTTAQEVGIKVMAQYKLLPGYTTDRTAFCTSSGSFELLTITFTPTQDCVFDLHAHVKFNDATSLDAVWDDLQITQAP